MSYRPRHALPERCPRCCGSGECRCETCNRTDGENEECPFCHGSGHVLTKDDRIEKARVDAMWAADMPSYGGYYE